jgi:hypothetical protein
VEKDRKKGGMKEGMSERMMVHRESQRRRQKREIEAQRLAEFTPITIPITPFSFHHTT